MPCSTKRDKLIQVIEVMNDMDIKLLLSFILAARH